MNVGLFLIIPALGGYWFLINCHRTNHQIARGIGYHVLFQASVAGGIIFSVSHLIILIVHNYLPQVKTGWQSLIPYPFADSIALGILLCLILPFGCNRIWTEAESALKAAANNGDLVELKIRESLDSERFIEITLRTGKVYIGRAVINKVANIGEPYVSLIPTISGYRDKDTQELEITDYYDAVIAETNFVHKDFQVVILRSEIVSARLFDPDTYLRFQRGKHRRRPRR